MGWNGKWADFVVEKPAHGEPVERLIAAPADAAVVHVRRDGYAQALFAASEIVPSIDIIFYFNEI